MLIIDYLLRNAQKYPDAEAIAYIDSNDFRESLSWKEFDDMSNQVAYFLRTKKIKKGDKVGLLHRNSLLWLLIYFGILKSGAIAVLLNYNNSIDEIEHCVKHTDCKGIILSSRENSYFPLHNEELWICDLANSLALNILFQQDACKYENFDIDSQDIATIYFSSGTTGRSKAIEISHAALLSAAKLELAHHKQQRRDRFLCVSPLYHAGAKIHWFGNLLVAGAVVIADKYSPTKIIDIIEREKITIAFLLLPQIQDILSAIEIGEIKLNEHKITQWWLMHSGAQTIPQEIIVNWHNRFYWQSYDTNYGLTEVTGPGCIHLGIENIHKAGSIGKPDPNWEVQIVANGQKVKQEEIGEIMLKGPGIMNGYYNDDIATNEVIIDGWLYTGDMAYYDKDGFIYIVDRKKDVIISGGENIYSKQIEDHIRRLDCVKDVAVIGISNARMGELVAAVVEIKTGENCSKNELLRHCSYLPPIQRPCKYVIDKIIRNSVGKPDKKEMRRYYFHEN